MEEIKYIYEKDNKRLVAYDGEKRAGMVTYSECQDFWILDHTYVDSEYGGRGIAKKLVKKLAEEAEKQGIQIQPLCSFAVKEFEKNEDDYKKVWRR